MDVAAQVEAARTRALVVPATGAAVLIVTGSDRVSWLNGLVTCDLAKLRANEAAYGLAVAQKGRIISEIELVVLTDRVACVVPGEQLQPLREALERYLIMEDAEMRPEPDAYRVFRAHGPRSGDVLDVARAAGADGAALDATGLGGALILAPPAAEAPVCEAMAGQAAIGDDEGWEALRLERGVPRWGRDFDPTLYPQEASLERRAVSFEKGCYLGQEVVCMLEMRGHVKRRLVSLVIDRGEVPQRDAAVVTPAGEQVGQITSAVASPTLGVPVALAMLKYAAAKAGGDLVVGGRPARIVERPA